MKTTLLIMAAGLGSRYGGDKQIDGIGPHGEMLMQYSIYDAIKAGFNKLVFVIKPQYKEIIEKLCGDFEGIEKQYVYQDFSSIPSFYKIPEERTKPFGTVHAVLCAGAVINEPFAVINADDFYGADAFKKMHDRLVNLKGGEATMVAYKLKNTVSLNGAVTRGICQLTDGKLSGVKETYKITVDKLGNISDSDSGALDGEALVSMNMWGFRGEIFENMSKSFDAFLKAIPDGEIKAEYALPTMVDEMIKSGELGVDVLSTDAVWFGVTYREDRAYVAGELAKMHEAGVYPEKLA
ncbi:MAG: hypothetical protein IJZ83_00445 [Clostridia bacterium]|nr:hypothetical protein [Clostridia bacterium]